MDKLELEPTKSSNYQFRKRSRKGSRAHARLPDSVAPSRKELRMRRLALCINLSKSVAIICALCVLATYAVNTWRAHTKAKKDWRVSRITIDGRLPVELGGLTQDDVKAAAGLTTESNIWDVDLNAVRQRISQLPQIRSVSVERHLPSEIRIHVEERMPIAWLVCPKKGIKARDTQAGRLIDDEMRLLECRSLTESLSALPEIHVTDLELPETRQPAVHFRLREGLELLKCFARTDWPHPMEIASIDLGSEFITRTQMNDGALIDFAPEGSELQMMKLASIYHYVDQNRPEKRIATARMQQTKNIAVTYKEGAEQGPPAEQLAQAAEPANATPPARRPLQAAQISTTSATGGRSVRTIYPLGATPPAEAAAEPPAQRPIRRLEPEAAPAAAPEPPPEANANEAAIQAILRGA
jgi:hypothetical protein